MEKTLTVPRPEDIPQLTGYWCGPATCQTTLQVIGITVEEADAAQFMGTSEDGTSHIGLLADYLNTQAHHAQWEAVWLSNDPPSREEAEQFWTDLRANIDAGFAMPANWVSPDGNHPQAVSPTGGDPGPNPGYYGTVFHYVTYIGYADNDRGRFILMADSGFAPWQYWVTFEQACLLMPPKGYVKAAAAPAGVAVGLAQPGPYATCLTGRPHNHSENAPTDQQVLDIRAEGLITQALVYAIAEKLGIDARGIYDGVKDSF